MDFPKNIEHINGVNEIKHEIGVRKDMISMVTKSLGGVSKKTDDDLLSVIDKFATEISILEKRMNEIVSKSTRKKYNFPIIDVPASGNANWWEGAYTLCFVYSKHNGNFILRGWRGEVMEYLKKNYTHYFYYVSMWHNGISRGHWGFWKKSVSVFRPSKPFKEWKYRVVKYVGKGSIFDNKKEMEFSFKRMPKRWIKKFDKL